MKLHSRMFFQKFNLHNPDLALYLEKKSITKQISMQQAQPVALYYLA